MENIIEDHRKQWMLLIVVALALFLDGLDGTIVNVVLPDIAEDFGIGLGMTSWVVTVYFLMMAGLILVIGKIADSGAIKKLFVAGLSRMHDGHKAEFSRLNRRDIPEGTGVRHLAAQQIQMKNQAVRDHAHSGKRAGGMKRMG